MTEKEVITRQEENGNSTFYLIRIGLFFKAYEHGAFALHRATGYAVKRRHRKTGCLLQAGFPAHVIEAVCRKLADQGAEVRKINDETWTFSGIDGTPDDAVVEEPMAAPADTPDAAMAMHPADSHTIVRRYLYSNVFHELKTLLNGITGYAEMLAVPGAGLDSDEKTGLGRHILKRTRRMTAITDDMIELLHYELLQRVELTDRVAVNHICRQVTDILRNHTQRGVQLHFDSRLPADFTVQTNEECLTKVLCHLLDASMHHTSAGSVSLSVVGNGRPGHVVFTVSDTGMGFPAARRDVVFDMIRETDERLKTTGLNLMLCQRLVSLLGGTISIDRHFSSGTRIVFDINN